MSGSSNDPGNGTSGGTSIMPANAPMTRRLRIRHITRVAYAQAVISSHNEVG